MTKLKQDSTLQGSLLCLHLKYHYWYCRTFPAGIKGTPYTITMDTLSMPGWVVVVREILFNNFKLIWGHKATTDCSSLSDILEWAPPIKWLPRRYLRSDVSQIVSIPDHWRCCLPPPTQISGSNNVARQQLTSTLSLGGYTALHQMDILGIDKELTEVEMMTNLNNFNSVAFENIRFSGTKLVVVRLLHLLLILAYPSP